ncbi:hypothetical protein DPMN_030459 [Dreissena polymorpha]|uniref:Uncharacterized protein n=1 Tax=Dreissena polymorpha TaxID=45954 RepID=A0A9D4M0W3_DREPO|nr:hypothetical protein DPMN_030459 [Dreissena polymorpha]
MSPCQRRISSDTRIELQRNASGARHILNETRRHSSAELNRNDMSKQGLYSEKGVYRCVSGCSTPSRSGHCQTNRFVPNCLNDSEFHDVRAVIFHFYDMLLYGTLTPQARSSRILATLRYFPHHPCVSPITEVRRTIPKGPHLKLLTDQLLHTGANQALQKNV